MIGKLNRKLNEALYRWATGAERRAKELLEEKQRLAAEEEQRLGAPRSRAADDDPYAQLAPENLEQEHVQWQLEQTIGGHEYVTLTRLSPERLAQMEGEVEVRPEQPVYLQSWLNEWDHRMGVKMQRMDDCMDRLNGTPTRQELIDQEIQARRSEKNVRLASTVDVEHLFRTDLDDEVIKDALTKVMIARAHNAATPAEETMTMMLPAYFDDLAQRPEEEPWS